jgi:hypothetical protein
MPMTDLETFGQSASNLAAAIVSVVRGVPGMEMTRRRPRLRALAAQFLFGIAALALITFVCLQLSASVLQGRALPM